MLDEDRHLICQRFLEGGPCLAAYEIGFERRERRDDIGVAQVAQHCGHLDVRPGVSDLRDTPSHRASKTGPPAACSPPRPPPDDAASPIPLRVRKNRYR